MDEQGQYQQLPPGYGSPGETGTVLASHQNPYALQPPQTQEPVTRPQQPGIFDSVPYHSWLAKNVKNPWEASDEDLTGKHFNDYIDGPIKSLVKAQLASGHKEISADQLNTRADAIAAGLKLQKQGELNASLGDLKAHLAGLKGKAPATQDQSVTKQTNTPAGNYGSGLGYLVDNPVTRGLAEAGSGTLGAADYASNRFFGTPLKNPLTGERFTNEESQLEAPKDVGMVSKFVQGAADIAGSVSQAGAVGGGVGGPALLRGGAAIGVPQALNIAQSHEQETGKQEGLGKLAAETVADTAAGMIPFGRAGAGVIRNALTGTTAGIAGDLITRAIAGDQASPEEVAKSGLTSGILSAIMHLPASGKKKLSDALGGTQSPGTPEVDLDALAAKAAGTKGDITTGLPGFKGATLADKIGNADTPEELQAIHDEAIKTVPPEQQQAFTDNFNKVVRGVHADDNAPQVKPLQAQPAAVPGEAVKSEAAPSEAAAGANPVVPPKPVFKLPPSISRAQPKYGFDKIGFDSDLDKALYIVANPTTRSRAHSMYIDWLRNEVGLNGKQIVDMAARVKAAVKDASVNNRNPEGSDTHFDLPEVDHPELAPKPPEAPKTAVSTAPVEPVAAPAVAPEPPKGTVASMLAEPVKAPVLGARGRQVGSTSLKFASETDKLGYLYANADKETQAEIAAQLKARGVRDADAFANQVQAQVKARTKSNGLGKSTPAETPIGVIVPHVMQGVPLPPKGRPR